MIIYGSILATLVIYGIYRLQMTLRILGDIEDYVLDNNIWLKVLIPDIVVLILIIAMIIALPFVNKILF
jgi:hypothetical protein